MARRSNELFIGSQYMNLDGMTAKHPALITEYNTINTGKTDDKPIPGIGLDLETNHLTAELMLLGFWDNGRYMGFYRDEMKDDEDFVHILFSRVQKAHQKKSAIFYWNRLDPSVMFKQFLLQLMPDEQKTAMDRYGKIEGRWDDKKHCWKQPPVVDVMIDEEIHFGITCAIRSSIEFFFYREGDDTIRTVWAFDVAQQYENGLEKEATLNLGTEENPRPRLPYYSKMGEEYHLIDWDRFNVDEDFRNNVKKSNSLDARAVYDLAMMVQEDFKRAFGYYPRSLISAGSTARTAILATIKNKYAQFEEEKIEEMANAEVSSIGIVNHIDSWLTELGDESFKDFLCLVSESYSGGYIESPRYGYTPSAYYSDLASAYPSQIVKLYDLRGSKITTGTGEPPRIPLSYCFIRGTVHIPDEVNFHPIAVRNYIKKLNNTLVHYNGMYIASYTLTERDYLTTQGATFTDETWYNIKTTGDLSPLAEVVQKFLDLRAEYKKAGDTAQYRVKIASNSVYGILYECTDTFEEIAGEIHNSGYRAGEFYNPVYASIITSETRIIISKCANMIEYRGGRVILLATDSIFWKGTPEMLPAEHVREKKTTGFFEPPAEVHDMVCLGAGRYSYITTDKDGNEELTSKTRGLNAHDLHDPDGIVIEDFSWRDALEIVKRSKTPKITLSVRVLVSVGLILNNHKYSMTDLGLVVEELREVDLIVGLTKRALVGSVKDPEILAMTLIDTEPLTLYPGINGKDEIPDRSLPNLRRELMKMRPKTAKDKDKACRRKASTTYRCKKKTTLKDSRTLKYDQVRSYGYNAEESSTMSWWSLEKITEKLIKDGKIA